MSKTVSILKNDKVCEEIFFGRFPDGRYRTHEKVLNAKIPILRLRPHNFKMDIQFNKEEAIRNSLFVRRCVMVGPSYGIDGF